jgi:hypothetical protein
MNRKGMSPILVFIYAAVMLLLWAFFFGNILSTWGAANAAQTTGIEKLFWNTSNLWLFFLPLSLFVIIGVKTAE